MVRGSEGHAQGGLEHERRSSVREELHLQVARSRSYQAAGGSTVDVDAIRFWEAFGNLRWGISCIIQAKTYIDGHSPSVELASIGRRIAETEWELLNLMEAE